MKAPEQNRADVEKTGWMGALHHPHTPHTPLPTTPPPHDFMDHGRAEPGRFRGGGPGPLALPASSFDYFKEGAAVEGLAGVVVVVVGGELPV